MLTGAGGEARKQGIAHADFSLKGTIEAGDFKIDLTRRSVTLSGRELKLTSEEFDVLVFLAGHRQRLITPRTLLATSWTEHRVRQTQFLRVLMSLRTKLESAAAPGKHYLRTEPWVVYRFDPTSLSTT
jgi:two-component system, OmpR family, KDP operon response regulator KdpE